MSESFSLECPRCGQSLETLPGFVPNHDNRPYCSLDCAKISTHGNGDNGEPPILVLHITEHSDGMYEVGELAVDRTILTDTLVDLESNR